MRLPGNPESKCKTMIGLFSIVFGYLLGNSYRYFPAVEIKKPSIDIVANWQERPLIFPSNIPRNISGS